MFVFLFQNVILAIGCTCNLWNIFSATVRTDSHSADVCSDWCDKNEPWIDHRKYGTMVIWISLFVKHILLNLYVAIILIVMVAPSIWSYVVCEDVVKKFVAFSTNYWRMIWHSWHAIVRVDATLLTKTLLHLSTATSSNRTGSAMVVKPARQVLHTPCFLALLRNGKIKI